ncbi:hypothetical protein [Nannocystis sp. SCPEA4]|uniref:hypothetical protein n=1 Tax=Nannocystis sp. SCPEA4 TaxID=2996787 RepID=UPI0022709E70|nr:hypothetical protein [Nannocystis sp. SCPEA4]MCY1060413.1 hypothetical protein [Nannocystis sp. SCPEA4]
MPNNSVLALLAACLVSACAGKSNPPADEPKACTMEAKICPDGSAVGRTGPNCEFAPCPAAPEGEAPASETPAETPPADATNPPSP